MQATHISDPSAEPSLAERPGDDETRARLHGMWASVAPAWGEYADYAETRGEALTDRMLELSEPRPGERVLELACGAGGLGLRAAGRVHPGGEVILSDVVAEMTTIAAARAEVLELSHVSTLQLDLEDIEQPDQSYDVVLCREGLMFALDPARAAREMRRVLRPGGRIAIAVWGPRADNPWLGLVLEAASAQLGTPIPPPGMPGPFSLEDSDKLARLLADAELTDIAIETLPVPTRAASLDEWWTRTTALAGPLANILAMLPEGSATELRARAQDDAGAYRTPSGVEFPGLTLIATARRP
jgi:ubiquinone/menaquinone biosynthesis C-methylase UbiE